MSILKKMSVLAICFSLVFGCNAKNSPSNSEADKTVSTTNLIQQTDKSGINTSKYEELISLDNEALTRKALSGDLGSCKLEMYSNSGCAGSSNIPLYTIKIGDMNAQFPNSLSGQPLHYCLDRVGEDLKNALKEGFCFSNHIPYDQISDDGLARKALLGSLGNCKLVIHPENGCGGNLDIPLFNIHLKNKNINFPNMSSESIDSYCLNTVGSDLRKALDEGYCFDN